MAGRFRDGFVDEVRAASSIVSIVSAHVSLKKLGGSWKGLCPFHKEKTPSFNVNEDRGVFHCFGCQEGGDVFKFVMLYDKVSFPEALRKVATLSGVPLPREDRSASDDRRERLLALNERALEVYRSTLGGPHGSAGRSYLEKRGIGSESIERFELGVTPEGWEGVSAPLLGAGYKAEEIVAAGLAKERSGARGIYDRFHDRLIFPIRAASGRLVGFGGRSLSGQEPKYLNSPETEVYSKSDVLYGLHLAKDAMRRSSFAILVEGYLDLVALHQGGFLEAVASLGTSLTERHAALLGRFVRKVFISYDGDKAGRNAAKRALGVLLAERLETAVVELAQGQDPDDLLRSGGAGAYRELLERAEGFVPFLVRLGREGEPEGRAGSTESRVRLVNEVLPLLATIPDPIERAMHARSLGEAAGIEDDVLLDALRKAAQENRPLSAPAQSREGGRTAWIEAEAVFLAAALVDPEGRARLVSEADAASFSGLVSEPILAMLREASGRGSEVLGSELLERLDAGPARDLLGRVLLGTIPAATPEQGQQALIKLRERGLRRELAEVQARVSTVAGEEQDRLLERKQELSRALEALRRA